MMVISIQSQVAYGHVGNSAAVFLHADARHRRDRGADHAVEQPAGLQYHPRPGAGRSQWSPICCSASRSAACWIPPSMILSRYSARPRSPHLVADFVAARQGQPSRFAVRLADPVLGDRDRGRSSKSDIPPLWRVRVLPLADIIISQSYSSRILCAGRGHDLW